VRLIEALLRAAPRALRSEKGVGKDYPEFRAWHAMLAPLFGTSPPDWTEKPPDKNLIDLMVGHAATDGDGETSDDDVEEDMEEDEDGEDA
jgi:putative DNA methylase